MIILIFGMFLALIGVTLIILAGLDVIEIEVFLFVGLLIILIAAGCLQEGINIVYKNTTIIIQ